MFSLDISLAQLRETLGHAFYSFLSGCHLKLGFHIECLFTLSVKENKPLGFFF